MTTLTHRLSITSIALLVICIHVMAGQRDTLSVMQSLQAVTRFSQLYPQEKVYLHFDNTGYFIGETIWYKAYIVQTVPGVRRKRLRM